MPLQKVGKLNSSLIPQRDQAKLGSFSLQLFLVWGAPKGLSHPFTFPPNQGQFPHCSSNPLFHGDAKMHLPNRSSLSPGESSHTCVLRNALAPLDNASPSTLGQHWLGKAFSCLTGIWAHLKDVDMTSFVVEDRLFNPGVRISKSFGCVRWATQ